MAVSFPQFDRRPDLSGGSDAWDDGLAGQLLTADYFEVASGSTSLPIGLSTETDSALPRAPAAGGLPVGVGVETDTAVARAAVLRRGVDTASEADAALGLTATLRRVAGLAAETDTASLRGAQLLLPAKVTGEVDSAFALPPGGVVSLPVGLSSETDVALQRPPAFAPGPPVGAVGGGSGHTGAAARKHRWEADKQLWSAPEKRQEVVAKQPAAPKSQPINLRDTSAARALLEKALAPKAVSGLPSASILTTIVEDCAELEEEFEALLAFALLD